MTWATLMSSAASYDAAACVNLTDVAGTSREARPQAPQAQLLCQSSARIASLESSIRPDATAIPSTLDHNTTKERRLPKPISFRDPGDLTEYVFVDHKEKGNMISDESGDPLKPKHVPRSFVHGYSAEFEQARRLGKSWVPGVGSVRQCLG
ncbi:hypothetical protein PMIN06_010321 [Paraphaeosphaeria minitans]